MVNASSHPESAMAPALQDAAVARRNRNVILGGALAIGLYGSSNWWQDGLTGDFRTVNEGWFGRDTNAGGTDKLGHAFSTYAATRLLAQCFEELGNSPDDALWLGAATSFGTLLTVELVDGFSKKFRFSKEDVIMNAIGTGLGILFEKNRKLDDLLDFRLMYWPSSDARRLNQVDPAGDYSGQTYLLVAKASGVPALRQIEPLKYFELAVGYGARGYEPENGTERSRHLYLGVSLNLAELFDATLFRNSRNSRAQRITNTVLEYVQVPGTAVPLANHSF